MKKIIILAILAIAGYSGWHYFFKKTNHAENYNTVKVERGDMRSEVSATGTLNPVITVEVGSQVSGTIKELFADFNSKVKKGQILAVLDQRTFVAQRDQATANLANAEANIEKANADLLDRKLKLTRLSKLLTEGLVAQSDKDSAESAYLSGEALVRQAVAQKEQTKAALELIEVNLQYTIIKSPVDGIVISRNVDIGQTVAASFQTPTLFTIAQDMAKMQVTASIDEADIGVLKEGLDASFTVDAFPEIVFTGIVTQIRNAPRIIQNVVTYDVVIDVNNKELKLKPGMTANVAIVALTKDNVLKIPVAALRFKPPESKVGKGPNGDMKKAKQGLGTKIWILKNEQLKPIYIKSGISDGSFTEVIEGDLEEGDEVVVDSSTVSKTTSKRQAPSGFHGGLR